MRRFLVIAGQECRETARSRPFKVFNVIFIVILVIIAALAVIVGVASRGVEDSEQVELIATDMVSEAVDGAFTTFVNRPEDIILVDDRTGAGLGERLQQRLGWLDIRCESLDEAKITAAIEGGDCGACVIISDPLEFEYYEKGSLYGETFSDEIAGALSDFARRDRLGQLGVSGADADSVLYAYAQHKSVAIGESDIGSFDIGKYFLNYMITILMFLVIGLYGQLVATRVATEKSTRTMELLATSATPVELMCGKVFGVAAASLAQLLSFIAIAAGLIWGAVSAFPSVTTLLASFLSVSALDVVWFCLYFLFGFLMIAFVYGGLGSMVAQVEDLSGLVSVPLYVFMVGYFIAIGASVSGGPNAILRISSMIPLWSPMTMFARMSVENVPTAQIVISLALLAGFSVLMALFAARLYRKGMLRYGKPPRISEIFGSLKK